MNQVLSCLVTALLLLTAALPGQMPDPPPPQPPEQPLPVGGGSDYSNVYAPKVIVCQEISSFNCTAALYNFPEREDCGLCAYYALSARREEDGVRVVLEAQEQRREALCSEDFLTGLQEIISRYDLAQWNGDAYEAHGLPMDFGAELSVRYLSGERLYAWNNRDMFLPLQAVRDMVELFEQNLPG